MFLPCEVVRFLVDVAADVNQAIERLVRWSKGHAVNRSNVTAVKALNLTNSESD